MKKKKLKSSIPLWIASFLFVSSWVVFGVAMALKTVNVGLNGDISFTATNVYARITANISGTKTINGTNGDLEPIEINAETTEAEQSWDGVKFDFVDENTPIVATITVENLSEERSIWVSFEEMIVASNVKLTRTSAGNSVNQFSTIEIPKKTSVTTSSKTFKIQMEIDNKNSSVKGNFDFRLNLVSTEPTAVASAQEFATAVTNADTQEYSLIKLTQDIDLTSLNSTFLSNGKLADNFKGEIDGNGHKITLNSEAKGDWSFLFKNIEGYFHDFTLHFPDISEKEINFANNTSGVTVFENITTTGSISTPSASAANNWSPYVNFVWADITFKDCTNALNAIVPDAYGSLFIGGRVRDKDTTQGIVDNIKVNYINCKNIANVEMKQAGFLYGNLMTFPKLENITIINCVNEGTILGYQQAGLFIGYINENLEYCLPYYNHGDYNTATGTKVGLFKMVGDNLKNSGDGKCITVERKVLLELNSENKFQLKNLTAGRRYEVVMTEFHTYENESGGETSIAVVASKTFTATSSSSIDTGIYRYEFLQDYGLKKLTDFTKTEITDWVVGGGDFPCKAYLVHDNITNTNYYYISLTDVESIDVGQERNVSLVVYEYDANGEVVGFQNVDRIEVVDPSV